ncbi:metallophosphoesterase family protein [Mangrovimicrobium sediminis]|uniref:metallophosphoesterase family protein n=1 Tax=Mangrovimicrobium sediminis TaxID=2562682 RepID=UPI0014368697|nr:metallophosphoesterase [Haliea sp. SAOS-164]
MRFAQISDPHLSSLDSVDWRELLNKRLLGYLSWRRKRRHEHRGEVLEALQRDLQKQELAQLLVTGDLTHVGLPKEFGEARAWLQRLGNPADVAVVPGNHDAYVRSVWDKTFAQWREYMQSDEAGAAEQLFPSLRVRGELAFIGLSSAVPKPPLLATGTLGEEQLERLAQVLAETRERGLFRVVYLHHPLLAGSEKWRKRLTDAAGLRAVLAECGTEMVLHGHGHRATLGELPTRHGPAPVFAVPSASAMGLHGADHARYNCYAVEREGERWRLEVESHAYDCQRGEFLPERSRAFSLAR